MKSDDRQQFYYWVKGLDNGKFFCFVKQWVVSPKILTNHAILKVVGNFGFFFVRTFSKFELSAKDTKSWNEFLSNLDEKTMRATLKIQDEKLIEEFLEHFNRTFRNEDELS